MGVYYPDFDRIEVKRSRSGAALTTAHEFGHFVEHRGLGREGSYESKPVAIESKLFAAIRSSKLVEVVAGLRGKDVEADLDGRSVKVRVSGKYVDYLLNDLELFARGYAQWIAVRSKDATMLKDLKAAQDPKGKVMIVQWADDDFEPIAKAFDALFEEKGWIPKK
jgi:hypothetical protein